MGSVGNSSNKAEAIELYRKFIEGHAYEIHEGSEENKKKLDKLFEPLEKTTTLYKGIPVTEDDLDNLDNLIQSYSSTSVNETVARDYADNAYDLDGEYAPLIVTFTAEKGTPVLDARKMLGTGGMRGYEKEITIGRNVKYEFGEPKLHIDKNGDAYYTVEAKIKKRRKK